MSYCAPIRELTDEEVKFKGAYCQDRVTKGELGDYFDISGNEANEFFLFFAEDEEYEKQGWDNWRGKNVSEESNIRKGIDLNEKYVLGLELL